MFSNLRQSDFARNILTLLTGSSISQSIPILVSPLIARLYSPEDFGNFALYLGVIAVLGAISTAMFEAAIVLPEKDEDAIQLLGLSIGIAGGLTCIAFFLAYIIKEFFSSIIQSKVLLDWIYIFPLSILLSGLIQAFSFWSIRKKKFKRIAVNKVVQNSLVAGGNIGGGFLHLGLTSFIWSSLLGQFVSLLILVKSSLKNDKINWSVINGDRLKENASKYKDFPRINMFHVLGDTLQASVLVFVISSFWGASVLGFYAFMMRVLRTPLNLIGASVGQVFYQRAGHVYNEGGDLHALLKQTLKYLFFASVPIFLGIILAAPAFFTFAFGAKWAVAGGYSQILSLWLFFNFLYSPVSQIPIILNKQKISFMLGVCYNLLILLTVIITGYFHLDISISFAILSICMSLYLIISLRWLLILTKKSSVLKMSYNEI